MEGRLLKPGIAPSSLTPGMEPTTGKVPTTGTLLARLRIEGSLLANWETGRVVPVSWLTWGTDLFNEPTREVMPWVTGATDPTLPSRGRL